MSVDKLAVVMHVNKRFSSNLILVPLFHALVGDWIIAQQKLIEYEFGR
jgi:hypothetical protein